MFVSLLTPVIMYNFGFMAAKVGFFFEFPKLFATFFIFDPHFYTRTVRRQPGRIPPTIPPWSGRGGLRAQREAAGRAQRGVRLKVARARVCVRVAPAARPCAHSV